MKHYVRAREFGSDNATYYWDSGRHEWSTLSEATVVNEDDVMEFNIGSEAGNVRVGYAKISTHFPAGRWEELPMILTLRSKEDLGAEFDRRYELESVNPDLRKSLMELQADRQLSTYKIST